MISENNPSLFCNNSLSSTMQGDAITTEEHIQSFAKQMLQSRLFIGDFQEKRYVDSLQSYRDVIVISNQETDLIRDLEVVRKRVCGYYKENYWVGITEPNTTGTPAGYCLWVELPDEVFGSYWYKISRVKFRLNEVLVRLRIIRPVLNSTESTTNFKICKIKDSEVENQSNEENQSNRNELSLQNNLNKSLAITSDIIRTWMHLLFTNIITIQNTVQAVKFTSVLLAAIFAGALQFVQYLGEFSLKFMREFSIVIKSVTPIILGIINLIAKIIGGFYLLILSMWRDRKGPPPIYQSPYANRPMIMHNVKPYDAYNTVYFKRSLPAPPRRYGSARITPLD